MPSIPIYAVGPDLTLLLAHLNADPEIAFIVPDGARRWRAIPNLSGLSPGPQALWHTPSGALPLLGRSPSEPDIPIADPYAGWEERLPAAGQTQPFFGSHAGIIWLYVPALQDPDAPVPMSAFGWIGDRYRATGHGAAAATTRLWRGLQRWIRRRAILVPRGGLQAAGKPEVAAFPAALARLQAGSAAELNPPAM